MTEDSANREVPIGAKAARLLFNPAAKAILLLAETGRTNSAYLRLDGQSEYVRFAPDAPDESVEDLVTALNAPLAYWQVVRLEPHAGGFVQHFVRIARVDLRNVRSVDPVPVSAMDLGFLTRLVDVSPDGLTLYCTVGKRRNDGARLVAEHFLASIDVPTGTVTMIARLHRTFF